MSSSFCTTPDDASAPTPAKAPSSHDASAPTPKQAFDLLALAQKQRQHQNNELLEMTRQHIVQMANNGELLDKIAGMQQEGAKEDKEMGVKLMEIELLEMTRQHIVQTANNGELLDKIAGMQQEGAKEDKEMGVKLMEILTSLKQRARDGGDNYYEARHLEADYEEEEEVEVDVEEADDEEEVEEEAEEVEEEGEDNS
jgi:hypothetical protein